MARLSKEFVKMEVRMLNDHRYFTLSEPDRLIYLEFLMIAKLTRNKIPKNWQVIKAYLRTNRSETDIISALNRIKDNFPKFKENKYFYHFTDFDSRFGNYRTEEEEDKEEDKEITSTVINDLNLVCKTSYKLFGIKTRKQINTRLKEGFTLEDFKSVHRKKYAEWANTDMEKFLRPETLYSNKFEGYLNQKDKSSTEVKYS